MDLLLKNKTVIVTGGCKGIGEATVKLFFEEGATVIILDKIAPHDELNSIALYYKCDVSREAEVQNVFAAIGEDFGTIDILINNAGIQTYGAVADTSMSTWQKTLDVNLTGIFLCSRAAIPILSSTGAVILNVASVMSFMGHLSTAAYATSKSAVIGLTRSLAIDYADRLRCVAICPGVVDTPMLHDDLDHIDNREQVLEETRNIHLLKRIASAEEIAAFIVFLSSERAAFATGQAFRVDGGIGIKIEGI